KKQTIHLDQTGICDACRMAEMKKTIAWDKRENELSQLCDRHRRNDAIVFSIVSSMTITKLREFIISFIPGVFFFHLSHSAGITNTGLIQMDRLFLASRRMREFNR